MIMWIILSKGAAPKPPRHYLNVNPPRENNFYHFDKDLPQEIPNRINHEIQEWKNQKPNQDRLQNMVLLKAQEDAAKRKSSDDLIEPLDQKKPKNIEAEEDDKQTEAKLVVDSSIKDKDFKQALLHSRDSQNNVILGIVDKNYVDFALNFYEVSLRKNDITNFLFICLDESVIGQLHTANIDCFYYGFSQSGNDENSRTFGSSAYFIKTNVKTRVMLHALSLGFNILLVDLDVVLFKNPMPYFRNTSYDLQISMDRTQWNTGFMYARPTNATKLLFETAWNYFLKYHRAHDQAYVAMKLRPMLKNKTINILELSNKLFPNGYYYFQYDRRTFRNEPVCHECVMTHNNYVGTADAKIYRFKENLMWSLDQDGYYSDEKAQYMMYSSEGDESQKTWLEEVQALHNALVMAKMSDRILVLPTFRCCDCKSNTCANPNHKCSLMHTLKLNTFNAKFGEKYREHVFFEHSKVPENLKTSVKNSPLLSILTSPPKNSSVTANNDFTFTCERSKCNMTVLGEWLRHFDDFPVIRFNSLYGNIAGDVSKQSAFKCGEYEQWEVKN